MGVVVFPSAGSRSESSSEDAKTAELAFFTILDRCFDFQEVVPEKPLLEESIPMTLRRSGPFYNMNCSYWTMV